MKGGSIWGVVPLALSEPGPAISIDSFACLLSWKGGMNGWMMDVKIGPASTRKQGDLVHMGGRSKMLRGSHSQIL